MSQVGNIISISSAAIYGCGANCWSLCVQYLLDAGGQSQAQIFIGSDGSIPNNGITPVPSWTSPSSTISVALPGAAAPVLLACPRLVQKTTFGVNG
jgi:hypothetical protein